MDGFYSNIKPVISNDGSHTLFSTRFGEHYHSSFGAIQEADHIFIQAALHAVSISKDRINLFEVGFGTGLNALMAYRFAMKNQMHIHYYAVEAFPVDMALVKQLNYPLMLGVEQRVFEKMHEAKETEIEVSPFFKLTVFKSRLQTVELKDDFFDVIFFDAFSPETQPEMWQQNCFDKIYRSMKTGGVFTTYSCKGIVKRALKSVGFFIEKLPGPPGKREFVRAIKQ